MNRTLLLAIAVLAAAPAVAQQPADETMPAAAPAETEEELARRWEREQALYSYRKLPDDLPVAAITAEDLAAVMDAKAANATPLPPPCEAQSARTVVVPKPPAPCTPAPTMAQPPPSSEPLPAQADQPGASTPGRNFESELDLLLSDIAKSCNKDKGCKPPKPSRATAPPKPRTTAAPSAPKP